MLKFIAVENLMSSFNKTLSLLLFLRKNVYLKIQKRKNLTDCNLCYFYNNSNINAKR